MLQYYVNVIVPWDDTITFEEIREKRRISTSF